MKNAAKGHLKPMISIGLLFQMFTSIHLSFAGNVVLTATTPKDAIQEIIESVQAGTYQPIVNSNSPEEPSSENTIYTYAAAHLSGWELAKYAEHDEVFHEEGLNKMGSILHEGNMASSNIVRILRAKGFADVTHIDRNTWELQPEAILARHNVTQYQVLFFDKNTMVSAAKDFMGQVKTPILVRRLFSNDGSTTSRYVVAPGSSNSIEQALKQLGTDATSLTYLPADAEPPRHFFRQNNNSQSCSGSLHPTFTMAPMSTGNEKNLIRVPVFPHRMSTRPTYHLMPHVVE